MKNVAIMKGTTGSNTSIIATIGLAALFWCAGKKQQLTQNTADLLNGLPCHPGYHTRPAQSIHFTFSAIIGSDASPPPFIITESDK